MAVLGKSVDIHQWEGHRIEVRLRAFPRYLWMVGGFFVRVDAGRTFAPRDYLERGTTATHFTVQHGDRELQGKVECGMVDGQKLNTALRTTYNLIVDGVPKGEGVLRSEHWYITLGILGFLFGVVPLAFAFWVRQHY